MKRFLAFLLVCFILTGCTGAPTSTVELPPAFISDVNITCGDTAYGACLTRYAESCWQVEMTAPEAVKGLIFTITDGETEVGYDGLHFTFDTQKFPAGSVVSGAASAIDRLYAQPIEAIVGEDSCLASGSLGEEAFTLSLSKNRVPQKLELGGGMGIEFLRFDVLERLEEGSGS